MIGSLNIARSFSFPNEQLTWAGEFPFTGNDLCFGSEDGNLLFPITRNPSQPADYQRIRVNSDTVNGLVFADAGNSVLTSSVCEIGCASLVGESRYVALFPGGAHDIRPVTRDLFVASLGLGGLLTLRREGQQWHVRGGNVPGDVFYAYRLCVLGSGSASPIVACAGRNTGLGAFHRGPAGDLGVLAIQQFPKLDIVDVCPLPIPGRPYAAAAVTHDCKLLITRDILDETAQLFRFPAAEGTAYSLVTAGPDLFLLTNRALYIFWNYPHQVAPGLHIGKTVDFVGTVLMSAADLYVAYNRYLLLEFDDRIDAVDVQSLDRPAGRHTSGSPALILDAIEISSEPIQRIEIALTSV